MDCLRVTYNSFIASSLSLFCHLFVSRLPDGGLFNNLPRPAPFKLRFPSCSCSLTSDLSWNLNVLLPGLNFGCEGDLAGCVTSTCSRFDDVNRYEILHSSDMTTMYANAINTLDRTYPLTEPLKYGEVYESYDEFDRTRRFGNDEWGNIPFSEYSSYATRQPQSLTYGELRESYFFYPDHNINEDNRPLRLKWPTPTGITEEHAQEMCEDHIRNSTLGDVCGTSILGTDMYVDDAVQVCKKDVQLTDDLSWIKQSTPLLENLCEAAIVSNRTSWVLKRDLHEMEPPLEVVQALNCPHDCSANGECTVHGCQCNVGYINADCSVTEGRLLDRLCRQFKLKFKIFSPMHNFDNEWKNVVR